MEGKKTDEEPTKRKIKQNSHTHIPRMKCVIHILFGLYSGVFCTPIHLTIKPSVVMWQVKLMCNGF